MNEPASQVVLDLAILIDMYGDDSAETISPALTGFRNEATKYITQLQQAATRHDHVEIARLAHSLKGMSGLIGACQLMAWSQTVEQAARQQDQATLSRCWPQLTQLWPQLLARLESSLQQYGQPDA